MAEIVHGRAMIDGQMRDSPILMLIKTDRGIWRATAENADAKDLVKYVQHIADKDIPRMIDDMGAVLRVNASTSGLYTWNDTPPRRGQGAATK